jgi:D-alanyl-D-alanine carboxypeptidase/D-alanyl-D-alanine-endopeptidase (penicillin-binding protein 4)
VASSRRALALAATLLALAPATAASTPVGARVAHALAGSGLGARTSVTVAATDGTIVWDHAGRVPRVPASNEKLLTMVAALDAFGPDFTFATLAVSDVPVDASGVLDGPLTLVGSGDPTLSTRAGARARGWNGVATLAALAVAVRRAGVRRVAGDVVGDGSIFDVVRGGPGWKAGFLPHECAPLSGLAVDEDVVRGVPVWRPELRAAAAFRSALVAAGVRVEGAARTGIAPPTADVVALVESPPMSSVLALMGKQSDNFTAETVAKDLGAYAGTRGSTAAGARVVQERLAARGLDLTGAVTVDGSGLSREDRITTRLLVALIVSAEADPRISAAFTHALAIAGVDGTLAHRLRRPPAVRRVHAKTGTLNQASALSGIAPAAVFSVIVNGDPVRLRAARALQDAIAQAVAGA